MPSLNTVHFFYPTNPSAHLLSQVMMINIMVQPQKPLHLEIA